MSKRHPFLWMEFYNIYSFVDLINDFAINDFETPEIYDGFDGSVQ